MVTLPTLKDSGMTDEELANFLASSYSPSGMIKEHGGPVISSLFQLWSDLFGGMEKTNDYSGVLGYLKPLITSKFASVGYIFSQLSILSLVKLVRQIVN